MACIEPIVEVAFDDSMGKSEEDFKYIFTNEKIYESEMTLFIFDKNLNTDHERYTTSVRNDKLPSVSSDCGGYTYSFIHFSRNN